MELPLTGGCVCGEVRYECSSAPVTMLNCHCRDCQQISGGPYTPVVVVRMADFKFTKGAPQYYSTTRLHGGENKRSFCGKCGCRLSGGENIKLGVMGVTASSFDDPSWFKPAMDIFVGDAQHWDIMHADLPKHQQYMPRK
jgi:hypothetical protein